MKIEKLIIFYHTLGLLTECIEEKELFDFIIEQLCEDKIPLPSQ